MKYKTLLNICKITKNTYNSNSNKLVMYFLDRKIEEDKKSYNRNIKLDVLLDLEEDEHLLNLRKFNCNGGSVCICGFCMGEISINLKSVEINLEIIEDLSIRIFEIIEKQPVIKVINVMEIIRNVYKGYGNGMRDTSIISNSFINRKLIEKNYNSNLFVDECVGDKIIIFSKPLDLESAISVIEDDILNGYYITYPNIDRMLTVLEMS